MGCFFYLFNGSADASVLLPLEKNILMCYRFYFSGIVLVPEQQ